MFARAVDCRTYRLRLTVNGHFDPQQADRLSDIRKQVEGVMTADKFAGRDPILILNFLHSLEHACDEGDITEPTVLRVLKNFLVGSPQSDFLAYLGVAFNERGIDSILSYPAPFIGCCSSTPQTPCCPNAFRAFQRMRQSGNETEEMFARRVHEQVRLMARCVR